VFVFDQQNRPVFGVETLHVVVFSASLQLVHFFVGYPRSPDLVVAGRSGFVFQGINKVSCLGIVFLNY
jgi:hypothetical protein